MYKNRYDIPTVEFVKVKMFDRNVVFVEIGFVFLAGILTFQRPLNMEC